MNAQEVSEKAKRLAKETRDSEGWRMQPATAFYHDSSLNGDGDVAYDNEDGASGWAFDVTDEEREAFEWEAEIKHVILHYSSQGGAPSMETATEKQFEEYMERLEAEAGAVEEE